MKEKFHRFSIYSSNGIMLGAKAFDPSDTEQIFLRGDHDGLL